MHFRFTLTVIAFLTTQSDACMKMISPDDVSISTPAPPLPCTQCDTKSVVENPTNPEMQVPTTWKETTPTAEGCTQYIAEFQAPAGQTCISLSVYITQADDPENRIYKVNSGTYAALTFTCKNDMMWGFDQLTV
ncbi:C6 domain-containing protein [Caenorhabditis elegans]|uniref:C6 domain-containing protein n=1 Tax=Caenorhabditis elegans TaxID=6239 RepID=Q9TYQ3_CAEEL|nr:C6 domain-containing protein [Caenorhabditis elegans]CCD70639.1 C6 domain-containing protein [Caenorhabditis elegans]|eukprot:NP_494065.1 Uncharacterized protein CELE_K07G6.1 [Caenorhabditis elegans]